MNRVTLVVIGLVLSWLIAGYIGWHIRPDCPQVDLVNIDSTTTSIEAANARADSLLRDTVRIPVPILIHEKVKLLSGAGVDSLMHILDAPPVSDGQ